MAQVDTSMYQNMQSPDVFGNIAKGLESGMRLRDMANQSKLHEQALNDDQSMRKAFTDNTVTDPATGQPSVNRPALMNTLSSIGPKGYEMSRQMQMQDAQQHSAILDSKIKNLDFLGRVMGPVLDIKDPAKQQEAYAKGVDTLHSFGIIDKSQAPQQFDADLVRAHVSSALTAKDQLENQFKAYAQNQKDQEIGIQRQKANVELGNKQQEAQKATLGMLESARGDSAMQQAGMDLYSARKAKGVVEAGGGIDKLTPTMSNLFASEIAKIARGGSPTLEELHGIRPETISSKFAEIAQKVNNEPTSANVGQFNRQLMKYLDQLENESKGVMQEKYGRVIDSMGNHLSSSDFGKLKDNYVHRFNDPKQIDQAAAEMRTQQEQAAAKSGSEAKPSGLKVRFGLPQAEASSAPVAHPMDSVAMQWAKANPKDPRSTAIFKANGQ